MDAMHGGWTDGWMHGLMRGGYGWMDGWMDECDGWMDGVVDGWAGGWMDGGWHGWVAWMDGRMLRASMCAARTRARVIRTGLPKAGPKRRCCEGRRRRAKRKGFPKRLRCWRRSRVAAYLQCSEPSLTRAPMAARAVMMHQRRWTRRRCERLAAATATLVHFLC